MGDYNFHDIFEPLEFQDFARDIVQIRDHIIFESFAEGKDMGIDGRYVSANGESTILQVKRLKSLNIMSVLAKEKIKLEKLEEMGMKIGRYILVISCDLSVSAKEKIIAEMQPFIINSADVIGSKDLNNYLLDASGKYKKVEEKYMKLWIQNAHVLKKGLQEIIHAPLLEMSKINLEKAKEKANVFVETEVYEKALKHVKRNRVLFITGEPGVGKTTLANQLALYFYLKYENAMYIFASSVDDLLIVKPYEGKKIVVFDDFWGSNFFLGLGNGADEKKLVMLIDYIRSRDDYILILTTRHYILEQGLKQNEDLRKLIDILKLECRIEQYSEVDKLRIYYGHLRISTLTWYQLEELMKIADQVILSDNYNPRVIEMFLKTVTVSMDADVCSAELLQYMSHPNDFWKKIYENLSHEAQITYLIMSILPLPIELKIVQEVYQRLSEIENTSIVWKPFSEVVKELEKTIVKTDCFNERRPIYTITFQNPSVRDYILQYVHDNFMKYYKLLMNSCLYFSQYIELLNIMESLDVHIDIYTNVMSETIDHLSSDCILFTQVYSWMQHHKKDWKRFRTLYRTNIWDKDIGFDRVFKLNFISNFRLSA